MNVIYNKENEKITIAVAMSGGVDSSTTAYLLKKQGYNIFGVTMKTCKDEDADAKKVCDDLGIPYYLLDATDSFKDKVIDYFVDEYKNGKTPNPCMICNRHIKFGEFLNFALSKGADFMATGHYAQIKDGTLSVGNDPNKDQVYFLSQIKKENLKYLVFPIGDMEKPKVRELAKELGVRVYAKKDSQEICFVDDGKLKEFLSERSNGAVNKPGNIVTTRGKILGKHSGLAFYTIGQRKGLGISSKDPIYVLKLDSTTNSVIVGSNEELLQKELLGDNLNLLTLDNLEDLNGIECFAKTRSRDKMHPCKLELLDSNTVKVVFTEEAVRAITPGQGVVFYDKDGRVIASALIK
ncbi:MAG: tRNA 2-thiouridine(34) synthase MnmA [Cetobacterium sp.]|uniref:tRNA 2-thiouridine(34) synthase MnmA n=1 Tax=Cetobacterium sp. TaxID=2071632 RepID=UPI002FC763E8